MRMNIKVIFSFLVILLFLVMGLWDAQAGKKVLRVGIIASLSGSHAEVGRDVRDGALLAIRHINEKWKDKDAKIEAKVMDDGASPARAKDAARLLLDRDGVDLIFGLAESDCALALMPVVNQAQIPMLTMATHAGLTHPVQKWIFRGNISDDDQAEILVDHLWDGMQEIKKIALLYEDSAYGRSGAAVQAKRIRQYKTEPVAEISYPRGERNFSSAIKEIKEAGAKGLLIYGMASDASFILTAVRELGVDVKIMASSGWDTRRLSDLPPGLTDGVIVAGYLAFSRPDREEVFGPSWAQFGPDFHKRFQRDPDVMAALAYSNMICVAEAYERVGFESRRLSEGLEKTKAFKTLLESLINFSDEGRDGVNFIHMTQFRDGTATVWRRNQLVRQLRFHVPARSVGIGEYRGKIQETQPELAMWMVLHFAFGRPPFIKDFTMIDDYGLKSCITGALFKGQVRVPVAKLTFRSEEEAIEALNLVSFDFHDMAGEGDNPDKERVNFRDADSGRYTDGTYWSGYERVKNVLVLAAGGIPLEDLQMILDEMFIKLKTP